MNKKILFVLISVCCNWGCTQNQLIDCTGESNQVSFETLLSSSASEICGLKNIDNNELTVNLIIKSQSEYENYISCSPSSPVVDFNEKTLLAGRMKTPNEDRIINQSVTFDCNGNYLYNVEIGYGIATHPIDVYYFAVIPKILPETRIDFNIVYLN